MFSVVRKSAAGKALLALIAASGIVGLSAAVAEAFPWSTDMFQGPEVQPLEMAPRVMPDGTLPIDGIHYNIHYGMPQGMAVGTAIPPMKLELMTIKLHNPLQPTKRVIDHGRALFGTVCAPCHGPTGKGDGSVVHLLQHKPANLMTGVSKNLPDGYIYGYIRNGGIWMPSYNDAMSSTERWEVVTFVRDLQKKYGETEQANAAGSTGATQAQPPSAAQTATSQAELTSAPGAMPAAGTTSEAPGNRPVEIGRFGSTESAVEQPGITKSGTTASLGSAQADEAAGNGKSK